ncbi:MAG TPA: glutaredoxin family protein [Planctomycetota bacterium]
MKLLFGRKRRSAPLLRLYTRTGCGLCQEVEAALAPRVRRGEFRLEKVDLDQDAAARALYADCIPVLEHAGRALAKGRFDTAEALARLARRIG